MTDRFFYIMSEAHTSAVVYRKSGPFVVAQSAEYQTARNIARSESRETSGSYTVIPPADSKIQPETFGNGVSEGYVAELAEDALRVLAEVTRLWPGASRRSGSSWSGRPRPGSRPWGWTRRP
jgi:hypothetical protein